MPSPMSLCSVLCPHVYAVRASVWRTFGGATRRSRRLFPAFFCAPYDGWASRAAADVPPTARAEWRGTTLLDAMRHDVHESLAPT